MKLGLKNTKSKRAAAGLLGAGLLSITLACNAVTSLLPNSSPPSEVTVQQNIAFGSGPFTLADPTTGLSGLPGYTATLNLAFDGTRDGQPAKWSKTYTMLTSKDPALRELTIQSSGSAAGKDPVFMAEQDGADYQAMGHNACSAAPVQVGNSLGDKWEPAGLLNFVAGADMAGSETVNNVDTDHYTFDQHALGQSGSAQSTGEVWVASDGGYVVKYLLKTQGSADYFGKGISGTLTWDYELTDIGKTAPNQLPADCPGGMIHVPQPQDATGIVNTPGFLAYTTSTSMADVATFYEKQLPPLGWKPQGQADASNGQILMDFQKGNQDLSIFVTADIGKTNVNISLERKQ